MIETREVLADAYFKGHQRAQSLLSHAVEVDAQGMPIRVLCERVKLDNLADRHASDPTAPPTCIRCQRKLRTK